ncbi:MAG: tyrosine-type recombinase/integrase, partial [Ignavibacteria bacterium]|nr:tyrosine-type recombinase/integrase [Ignavibacteria bacterium]
SKKNPQKMLLAFATEYSDFVRDTFSQKYLSSVQLSFRKMIEHLGDINLHVISTKDTQKFLTVTHQRTKRGAELFHRTLKAAFNRALEWEYINTNPFLKVRLPRTYKSHPIFISKTEFELILMGTQNTLLEGLFTLGFYTGLRLGELVNMKWKWINSKQGFITVLSDQNFMNKGKKDRIIPMTSVVKDIINQKSKTVTNVDNEEYLFTRIPCVKLNEDYVSRNFKKAVRKVNLNGKVHFHTLRHSFASNLVQSGVDLYVVKELLGHEDVRTTQIYSHLQSGNLFNAIKLLD